jgi:hypothetical protein
MQTVGCSGQASQLNELSTAKSSLVSEFHFSLHKLMTVLWRMQSVGRCYLLSFLYNGYFVYAKCRFVQTFMSPVDHWQLVLELKLGASIFCSSFSNKSFFFPWYPNAKAECPTYSSWILQSDILLPWFPIKCGFCKAVQRLAMEFDSTTGVRSYYACALQ